MKLSKRKALEKAGWRFGAAADFLEMPDDERQLLDARMEAALAVRRLREALNLSQKQLAERINTGQPRIVKIERAAKDVSLDQILKAYAAVGGRLTIRVGKTVYVRRERRLSKSKRTSAPTLIVELQNFIPMVR